MLAEHLPPLLAQLTVPYSIQEGVSFTRLMLRHESLMITSATWVIIQSAQKGLSRWADLPVFVRLKPAIAVGLSVAMAYLPSFRLGTWDETLLYGITLGSLAGLGQKLLKQTLMGKDHRIRPVISDPSLREKIDGYLEAKKAEEPPKTLCKKIAHFIT
jgi:hypothetical protein